MVILNEVKWIIMNIIFIFYTSSGSGQVTRTPRQSQDSDYFQSISARKAGDAVLRCDVTYPGSYEEPPPYVIEWFRGGVPIVIKVGKHPTHVNREFEGRMSIAGDPRVNASLHIANLTDSDDGWYECRVLFLRDERFEKSSNTTWVKLTVTDPPSFLLTLQPTVTHRQGDSLLLKCRATGRPQPAITWRKDGWLVKDGQNGIRLSGGDLAVTSLTTSHRGKYTCRAQSMEGRIQASTLVQVEAPPEFTKKPSNTTAQEGEDAMFECQAAGFPKDVTYSWSYNRIAVNKSPVLRGRYSIVADGTLIIYHVNTRDKGIVTCQASNSYGMSPSATASLSVQFKARVSQMPSIVYAGIGLKATLACPSEAEPPVNKVVWKRDGFMISPQQNSRMSLNGNGSLILSSASPRDAGRYTCTPSNLLGTLGESTASRLIVKDPPHFTLLPKSTYEFEIGKRASIPCRGAGDPPPAVIWRKILSSGETLQYMVQRGTLTITSVTKDDHGTWQCVLKNSVAEVTKDVQVFVKYTRPHKVSNVTTHPLSDTAVRVSWVAGYDGGYPQHFMLWYMQTEKIDPTWRTLQVEGTHTVAVVENLEPNTAYEFAVLPVNDISSGPFSERVMTKTLAFRPPAKTVSSILAPPHALFASKTDKGFVQLSWRKPHTAGKGGTRRPAQSNEAPMPYASDLAILGFLVEYRWTGVDPLPSSKSASQEDSQRLRKKRDTPVIQYHRKRRQVEETMPKQNMWRPMMVTYDNITTVVVKPEKLYRDFLYEFRVLTVSKEKYSQPSNPVSISTKGLSVYPCYTGMVNSNSFFRYPVVAGVIAATCLVALLVIAVVVWFCWWRKRRIHKSFQPGEIVLSGSVMANGSHITDGANKTRNINGNLPTSMQPTVVDLTNGGQGGYAAMEKQEFETISSEDHATTPFVMRQDAETNHFPDEIFRFTTRPSDSDESPNIKDVAGSTSDRSSVRMRRETAPRVLSAQLKRRSLTEHVRNSVRRDIPLRGGVRSASTSPESSEFSFARPDRLNVTSPAALEVPQGRRKIRLYSRPIDDVGSAQQRRMIVIKRKSQRSSSFSESRRERSSRAPPSDSSESPVFGVVGTINPSPTRQPEQAENAVSGSLSVAKTSPQKSSVFSPPHRSPFEDEVFSGHDVIDKRKSNDDLIARNDDDGKEVLPPWDSPFSHPVLSSSPKDPVVSPDPQVSPNRVVARHTVAYDPSSDATASPISQGGSNSPPEQVLHWGHRGRVNSLSRTNAKFSRPRGESSRTSYTHSPQFELTSRIIPQRGLGYDRFSPGISPGPHNSVNHAQYKRLSLSQHPYVSGAQSAYHPTQHVTPIRTLAQNRPRTRASYTFGHQPFSLPSPTKGLNVSMPANHMAPSSGNSPKPTPESTFEIDCSNSDIEVRFIKDADGNGYLQEARDFRLRHGLMSSAGSGEIGNRKNDIRNFRNPATNRLPASSAGKTQVGDALSDALAPTPDEAANNFRHTQRNMSTSDSQRQIAGANPKSTPPGATSPERRQMILNRSDPRKSSTSVASRPATERPRFLASPIRHLKLKSGQSDIPTSPPLLGIGSSDYGSQDTSNSSTSPLGQSGSGKNTMSPLHSRVPGPFHERPPRRDNSSVEDNYEWDSEIAMESEILEALRHFGTLKKTGPVSDELLDELNKFAKDSKEMSQRQRPHSADLLGNTSSREGDGNENPDAANRSKSAETNYSKESMARRCAALRAEFLHYQQLQQLDEDEMR